MQNAANVINKSFFKILLVIKNLKDLTFMCTGVHAQGGYMKTFVSYLHECLKLNSFSGRAAYVLDH